MILTCFLVRQRGRSPLGSNDRSGQEIENILLHRSEAGYAGTPLRKSSGILHRTIYFRYRTDMAGFPIFGQA